MRSCWTQVKQGLSSLNSWFLTVRRKVLHPVSRYWMISSRQKESEMKRTVDWPESLTKERLYLLVMGATGDSIGVLHALAAIAPTQAEVDALKPRTVEYAAWQTADGALRFTHWQLNGSPNIPPEAVRVQVPVIQKQESVRVRGSELRARFLKVLNLHPEDKGGCGENLAYVEARSTYREAMFACLARDYAALLDRIGEGEITIKKGGCHDLPRWNAGEARYYRAGAIK
jgi:hypothetical protein